MTLSKCKACGILISKKAKSCPQCGHPVKKTSILLKVLIILMAIPLLAHLATDTSSPNSSNRAGSHGSVTGEKSDILYIGAPYPTDSPVDNKYIRTNPSMDAPMEKSGDLLATERIYVLEESGEWIRFRVTAEDVGWSAWMPKEYVISLKEVRDQREAKFGPSPRRSLSNGSVYVVMDYIRSVAKDPKSIEFVRWSNVYYNDKAGWTVHCVYRGKNSFGGYTMEDNWFVIRHGQVVDVKDGDAYTF